jgi:hypothetical protein
LYYGNRLGDPGSCICKPVPFIILFDWFCEYIFCFSKELYFRIGFHAFGIIPKRATISI